MADIVVAVDGYAACGKRTLARDVARELDYHYLDTGAMYRAVTLYLLRRQVDWKNRESLKESLRKITITFEKEEDSLVQQTQLNGENVEEAIRSMKVADKVSEVAAEKLVRDFLVTQQRQIGISKRIVADGRDIGTVVFPQAECKLFVTARMEIRIERRFKELAAKGILVPKKQIKQNLVKRDRQETERKESPLKKAPDAILFDNSDLDRNEQLAAVLKLVRACIRAKS